MLLFFGKSVGAFCLDDIDSTYGGLNGREMTLFRKPPLKLLHGKYLAEDSSWIVVWDTENRDHPLLKVSKSEVTAIVRGFAIDGDAATKQKSVKGPEK